MITQYWTPEEDKTLISLWKTMPLKEMVKYFKQRTRGAIQKRSKRLNLFMDTRFGTVKKSYNKNFWSNINPISAYWAGFSLADSSVRYNNKGYWEFTLVLARKDDNHIKQFAKDINYIGNINYNERPARGSGKYKMGITQGVILRVCINDSWLIPLKENFNIIPNKTKRLAPPDKLNLYMQLCALIGYIDGDRCICASYMKKYNKWALILRFSCSSPHFTPWIKNLIDIHFPKKLRNGTNRICGAEKYYALTIRGIQAAVVYHNLKDFPVPELERKWHNPKFIEVYEQYKKDYPSFFEGETILDKLKRTNPEYFDIPLEIPSNSPILDLKV